MDEQNEIWRLIVWSDQNWCWEQIDSLTVDSDTSSLCADEAAEIFTETNGLEAGQTFLVSVDQSRLNLWEFIVASVPTTVVESKRVYSK
jgi:hypothetical protein